MLFDSIFVDVFNLAYRKSNENDYKAIANEFIDFMENDAKKHMSPKGEVYLLFDPLPKSDLGLTKSLRYSPRIRTDIVSSYKKDRKYSAHVSEAIKFLYRYYSFRGENYKICISNNLEADDFVEPLLSKRPGNVALITTDQDWARYISDSVVMINKGFDEPYTKEQYRIDNGIVPTIATVTLKKAIFGDSSDNIPPIFETKKSYYTGNIKDIANVMLMYIAGNNIPFTEVESHLKNANFKSLYEVEKRNPLEEFEYSLISIDPSVGSPYGALLDNIRVIKCRCNDASKYISWHPKDEKLNKLLDTTLGRISGKKNTLSFGNLKA